MKLLYSIKTLALTIALVLAVTFVNGATITITANTNWSNITTGSGVGGLPTSADAIIVRSSRTLTVDVSDAVCGSLQLGRVNSTSGTNAGTLAFSGTNPALTVTSAGGLSGAVTLGGYGNTANDGTITFSSTATLTAVSVILGNSNPTPAQGTITMTSGGTLICASIVSNTTGDVFTEGTGTVRLTGTFSLGATDVGNEFASFYNLQINSGTVTYAKNIAILSNLTVNTGATLDLSTFTSNRSAIGGTLTVAGTLLLGSNTGGVTGSNFPSNFSTFTNTGGTVDYDRTGTQTVAPIVYNNLTLSGSSVKTFPTGTTTVGGVLSMEGTATTALTGTLTYVPTSTLIYKGSATQTTGAEFPATGATFSGVKIENANGVTLNAAKNIGAKTFTIGSIVTNSIFNDGGFQLTSTGTLNLNSGFYIVKYSSFPAFTTGITIATGTLVDYAATATQTVKGITYSNLTISGTGTNSKTADADITVNGILNLSSANASATQGCLSMSTFTLNMGANAITTGTGDVTGIVKRTHTFADGTLYSFGNQYTTVIFAGSGTKPAWLSCQISIGTAPWTNAILRQYQFSEDANIYTDKVTANLHFLPGELNGNTVANLVLWDKHGIGTPEQHGKSNIDLTNNFIGLAGISVSYLAPTTYSKLWSLENSTSLTLNSWSGNDAVWGNNANWSLGHTPLTTEDVQIPTGKTFYPTMPAALEIHSLEIQSGASFATGSFDLKINGAAGAWINNGNFDAGTGTVFFTHGPLTDVVTISGTTQFHHLDIAATVFAKPASGSYMKISGNVTGKEASIVDLSATNTTVEYNGTSTNYPDADHSQIVINPSTSEYSGYGYYNLILSGTGNKMLASTPNAPNGLNVANDFTINGGNVNTLGLTLTTVSVSGNITLNSGMFDASSSTTINVGGNWTNNGGTFTPGTGAVTFNSTTAAQAIKGTATTQTFNDITINKAGQTLIIGGGTTTLNVKDLAITAGTFDSGLGTTINVTGNWSNSGSFIADGGKVVFNGSSAQTISGTTATNFHDLTINNTATIGEGNSRVSIANNLIAVTGILDLQSANASTTQGVLHTGSFTLNMGADATTKGIGDVTGYIKRAHTFLTNTPYSFGNQFTTLDFIGTGTQPSEVSCNITIGIAPAWKTAAVKRYYSFAQTGTAGTDQVIVNLHYLDGEIQSNAKSKLVIYDAHGLPALTAVHEHGKTNNSTTDNWVGLSGLTISYLAPATGLTSKQYALADYTAVKNTWNGVGTNWSNIGSWSNGHIPISTDDVLIPAGLGNYPTLSANAVARTIEIESGASLNASSSTITLYGKGLAWSNLGTFIPGTGTVDFEHDTISDVVSVTGTTQFNNLYVGANTYLEPATESVLKIAGTLTADASSILDFTATHNTVEYTGTAVRTIINPIGPDTDKGYYELVFSNTAGTITLPSELTITGDFTNNGAIDALANASTVVMLLGVDADGQAIGGTTPTVFKNLTINTGAGVTGLNDFTVNGILNLQSANVNPDPFVYTTPQKGSLDMATDKILTLGPNATNTGIGDVTGIVKRTSITTGLVYTLGNPYTTIIFPVSDKTIPKEISVLTTIGSAPWWKPEGIKRMYNFSQTDGSGTKAVLSLHYLDSELNGNTENNMSVWVKLGVNLIDRGRSNFDITNNFYEISDVDVLSFSGDLVDTRGITLANRSTGALTWNGSASTAWDYAFNWTPNVKPDNTRDLIIPDASLTSNDPDFTGTVEFKTLTIENAGVVNSTGSTTINVYGSSGAWSNMGTFNPGSSTVEFKVADATLSGSTDFNNVTINSEAGLRNESNSVMRIAGTMTNNGIWRAGLFENTIEYNGSGPQTVISPNGATPGYHNLILSGIGTKNLTTFITNGDLTIESSAIAGGALTVNGDVVLTSGTFTAGSYIHTVKGNWTNDGTTFENTGININFNGTNAQTISGAIEPLAFNNVTISNANGVALQNNATTAEINITSGALTIKAGKGLTAAGTTTLGATQCLVLRSDATGTASFIDNGTIAGTGTMKAERYLTPYTDIMDSKYHFLSSPVESQAIRNEFVSLPNTTNDFYSWDENTNYWINTKATGGSWNSGFEDTFTQGKGYLVSYASEATKNFVGKPYTSAVGLQMTCSYTSGKGNGWNLLGNPFPSPIDWDLVQKSTTGMDAALYYYDNAAANYMYYVPSSGGTGSRYIPAMQGFMVHANINGATVTMANGNRLHSGNTTYYKSASYASNILDLKVEGNGYNDYARVCFYDNASSEFDGEYDAYKLWSYNAKVPQIYSVTPANTLLAINTLPLSVMEGGSIPVSFKASQDGSFTLTAEQLSTFSPDTYITLEDKLTGKSQPLSSMPVYTFTATPQDATDRFVLHFIDETAIPETATAKDFSMYSSDGNITVKSLNQLGGKIAITDMMGRTIATGRVEAGSTTQINVHGTSGVYIVSVLTSKGISNTKVIVK